MCGINGFNWKDEKLLDEMNALEKHRGPDFAGKFFSDDLSLGHLLLAIREAWEVSKQPYHDSPEWVLLFNGQIYNTGELKACLTNLDPQRSDLDTYIIYKTIEKHGWDFTKYIEGMFAIALYNTRSRELRLYRDPAGQKQLYYYYKDGKFIFSSEIKSILLHNVDKTIDELGLETATAIGYIPGKRTLFKYIQKLDAAECLSWSPDAKAIKSFSYPQRNTPYFKGEADEVMRKLVEEHLQSKKRVVLNLSGGLDSSVLLHEMSKAGGQMHTYTTYFGGISDESSYNRDAMLARRLAKDYGSDHHEIRTTKENYLENFVEAYRSIEEPNFNISLPVYLQIAKAEGTSGDGNRVVLSGDGGDEVFGGYGHYKEAARIKKLSNVFTPALFNILKNLRNGTDYDWSNPSDFWMASRVFTWNALNKSNLGETKNYIRGTAKRLVAERGTDKDDFVYEVMLRDRYLWMPGENFIRSDKLFMSQTLEMRSPFAYEPFRKYMDELLTTDDYVSLSRNKVFLRNLYKGKLPDYIVEREDKTGWRSPIDLWYDDGAKKLFLDILPKGKGRFIDWQKVEKRIASSDKWPGKIVHLYLSLAILADKYKIDL